MSVTDVLVPNMVDSGNCKIYRKLIYSIARLWYTIFISDFNDLIMFANQTII